MGLRGGVKGQIQLFQNMVMLHIKLKGITNAAAWNQICFFPADPYPPHPLTLGLGGKCKNSTFSENGHVTYQIKESRECTDIVADIFPADPYPRPTKDPGEWVNRS